MLLVVAGLTDAFELIHLGCSPHLLCDKLSGCVQFLLKVRGEAFPRSKSISRVKQTSRFHFATISSLGCSLQCVYTHNHTWSGPWTGSISVTQQLG